MLLGLSEIAEGLMKVTLAFRLCISAIGSMQVYNHQRLVSPGSCRLPPVYDTPSDAASADKRNLERLPPAPRHTSSATPLINYLA